MRRLALVVSIGVAAPAAASPPACFRDDAAMVVSSVAVVAADVLNVRLSHQGTSRTLEARYRVAAVFKGLLKPGDTFSVRASCRDEPVPEQREAWLSPRRGHPARPHEDAG